MSGSIHAGVVLASRYRLDDLLAEKKGGLFWRAHDQVLHRPVAVHLLPSDDERAPGLMEAARRSATLADRRLLRVLDADQHDRMSYVVNEWGQGDSLDILLATQGPMAPRRAAWVVAEAGETISRAHEQGIGHGRLVPENILVDVNGQVRIIGFAVDAALHGQPPLRTGNDVVDLVGVLYAALTGRWAGVSSSDVPAAPLEHGSVLRPRKVRAGIPRALDALCDEVINGRRAGHRGSHDLTTAQGVTDALRDFVGDPTGVALERGADSPATTVLPVIPPAGSPPLAPTTSPDSPTRTTPVAPVAPVGPEDPAPVEPEPGPPPTAGNPTDQPTQAGVPVFRDDEDDVSWLQARADRPAPPPPFEAPPERPLFAPDPPDGAPVRRPRPGASQARTGTGADYWPWDTGTGTGSSGPAAADTADTGPIADVPGRNWFRLAMIIGLCTLVLVAAVAAYQLGGGGGSDDDTDPSPSATPSTQAAPTPFTGITADDFDPQGDPPQEESPELLPLVVDDDPATSWRTATYLQQFGPAGLKTGVGVVLDLGKVKGVREVDVSVVGETGASVYVTETRPDTVEGLSPVGEVSGADTLEVRLDEVVSGRYVTIWLTSLPTADGGYRGEISDVVVRG